MSIGNKKGIRRHKFVWGPSLTKQSFKDEANINKIIARYTKTGVLDYVQKNPGVYADLSKITNYKESLEKIIHAKATFDSLPANIRNRFRNDPAQLIDFMSDPKNTDEAESLGLITPRKKLAEPATPAKTKKPETEVPSGSTEPEAKGKKEPPKSTAS